MKTVANGGEMQSETTTIQALDDVTTTAEAPDGIALNESPLAALGVIAETDLQAQLVTGADADIRAVPEESAENGQPVPLQKTAADTDTEVTDIVIAAETKNDPLRDAHDPDLAPRDHRAAPHRVRYNAVARYLHNQMLSPAPAPEKQKPNFNSTGRLAAESNTIQVQGGEGIVLKYHEPPEARKPPAKEAWRMYVFKGEDLLETVELLERSCWLVGRERSIVDFPLDHPSCSKQHAVLQFRFVEKKNEFGDRIGKVKPYLLDLESANGSSVNGEAIPAGRYVEVMDKDVIRFGLSSREYVLMLPPS
ncbi:uncharacterized protein N7511_010787 [Penicillium nucicola]|uniref:uncharacterized protein n=1 Tax=Penicillium nucicola TaxID=1850975 RepID=UPI002545AC88|nr:uncharacterized protein N7511_010787 [Penicillium nucicola]KAJ5749091.1 hypothetical protein N7511_010787 [Penicillium nucicola]